jgi:hypothetical protein
MSTIRTRRLLGLAVVAVALLSLPLYGDTITDTNVQITAFVTSMTVSLQIQCFSASCSSWFFGDERLKGFSLTEAPVFGGAPSGYTLTNGGQNNTAVGSGGGCDATQIGAVCWDASLPLTTQLRTTPLFFSANITGGAVNGSLHFTEPKSLDLGDVIFLFMVALLFVLAFVQPSNKKGATSADTKEIMKVRARYLGTHE